MDLEIRKYNDSYRDELISVWERSVRATHDFLSKDDIEFFKNLVEGIDFNSFDVFCAFDGEKIAGILGVYENKLEMLFLLPGYIGKGVGKQLMLFSLKDLHVNQVDVNEGNVKAREFYEKFGFKTYDRTELDDHGKEYPILKMKL